MRESKLYTDATSEYKKKYESILQGDFTINGVTVKKNMVSMAIDSAGAPLAFTQRDPVTGQSGQNAGTLTDNIFKTQIGRYQVGSSVNSFLDNKYISGTTSGIGSIASTTMTGLGSGIQGIAKGLGGSTTTSINGMQVSAQGSSGTGAVYVSKQIGGYVAPITETMQTLESLGTEFDKIIKKTFLGQIFKIKGSEILCAMFCLLVSFLSCKQRTELADTINAVKNGLKTINNISGAISDATRDPVEVPLFNNKTMADNLSSLFPSKIKKDTINSALNIPKDTETKKQSVSFEIPPGINDTIKKIVMILNLLAKGQISLPVGITGDIWSFSQVVMSLVRDILVAAIDNFITKVVKDIEKKLKSMIPQMCVGNLAAKFINRIIAALNELKEYFLGLLKSMVGDANGFSVKWMKFSWYFQDIMDLLAMLKALSLILGKFAELALLCGISPCNNLPSKDMQEIQDAIRAGMSINETNEPANVIMKQLPKGRSLDELADTFRNITGQPDAYVVQDQQNTNSFQVILPDMFKDAPSQIMDIINSKEFLSTLGGAYTIYPQASSGISVVYTYELKC